MTQTANTPAQAPAVNPLADVTFDPRQHLTDIGFGRNKAKYLQVQWRLVWFRKFCPQGSIRTEEIFVDLDRPVSAVVKKWNPGKQAMEDVTVHATGYARYKAIVEDGHGGRAEATKTENAAAFEDFLEKAETGAIGRALAALGYGTQFTADELWDKPADPNIVDAPVAEGQLSGQPSEQAAAPATGQPEGTANKPQERRAPAAPARPASAPAPARPQAANNVAPAANRPTPARQAPAVASAPAPLNTAPAPDDAPSYADLQNWFTELKPVNTANKPINWIKFLEYTFKDELAQDNHFLTKLLNADGVKTIITVETRIKLASAIAALPEAKGRRVAHK